MPADAQACYDAILAMDAKALGMSMNDCMECWESLLPCVLRHRTITTVLKGIMGYYQQRYAGAMYSGTRSLTKRRNSPAETPPFSRTT